MVEDFVVQLGPFGHPFVSPEVCDSMWFPALQGSTSARAHHPSGDLECHMATVIFSASKFQGCPVWEAFDGFGSRFLFFWGKLKVGVVLPRPNGSMLPLNAT